MAPDIPMAMYNSGATTLPVCPTWRELSAYPASTAALEAPTAAPNASARGSNVVLNVSAFLRARPPEITREATPRSGLSDFVREVLTCSVDGSATGTASMLSIVASALVGAAAEKAVERTVKILIGMDSEARTVEIALPA